MEKVGESFTPKTGSAQQLIVHQRKRKRTTVCLRSLKWRREFEMTLGKRDCPLATCTEQIRMYCWCSPLLQTMAMSTESVSHRCTGHLHHGEGGGWWICKDFHRAVVRTDPEGSRWMTLFSLSPGSPFLSQTPCCGSVLLTVSIRTCPNVYVPCHFWLSFCVRVFCTLHMSDSSRIYLCEDTLEANEWKHKPQSPLCQET